MTRLFELQGRFQAYLLGLETDPDRGIEPLTVGSRRLPASQRLTVYADAYRLRLVEVLAEDFPGLKGLLGDRAFDELGRAYIDAHPSTHPSVRWFGRHLPEFLRGLPDDSNRHALAEMAAFEWAQGEVMDAADDPTIDVSTLGALPPESWPGMRLGFQRALRRLDLSWNVPGVWKAVSEGTPPPPLEKLDSPLPWLLWRQGMEVHWRSLDDDERSALDAARGGRTFGEICEHMAAFGGDESVPVRAAGFLKLWIVDGLVSEVSSQPRARASARQSAIRRGSEIKA
ncbi:MAG: DNA-binding domain-containing protein [Arenicellales bacterium]